MEKEPKSVWRRPWKGRGSFIFWLLIVPVVALIAGCVLAAITSISAPLFGRQSGFGHYVDCVLTITLGLIIMIVVGLGFCSFILWVFQARNFKRFLFGCACFATLVVLFYAEEDWRGKYEWDKFKREWEAKGENFDKDSVVPKAVPDDENSAMSPLWIAEIKYAGGPKIAKAWYGEKIYNPEVSNYFRLLPMSLSDVVGSNWARHLPDPPENSGDWAAAQMTDLRPWQLFYRTLEQTNPSADIIITPKPQTPAQDVLLALSKYDPLIERMRQDSQLPYSRFPIEYNTEGNPGAILVPQIGAVKESAVVLQLRAIAELQNGQTDKALADADLMFRLANADSAEPFLISELVRFAVVQIALQPIYEGLANHEWSDSQLVELDSKLSGFDFLADYKFSLRGEMIFLQEGVLEYWRRHPAQIGNMYPAGAQLPFFADMIANLIPAGLFYQNELHCVRGMERYYLPMVDTKADILSSSSVHRADAAVQAETRHGNPYNILERMTLPSLTGPSITVVYAQTAVDLARVAIALERYRLAHGQYPDSLDVLAPQFIDRLPHDIINGQPLHYQRTANGQFILYSVGWNETDDGGAVVMAGGSTPRVDRKKGDWVWRYPER